MLEAFYIYVRCTVQMGLCLNTFLPRYYRRMVIYIASVHFELQCIEIVIAIILSALCEQSADVN